MTQTASTRIATGITFTFTATGFAYSGRTLDINPDNEQVDVEKVACQEDAADADGIVNKKAVSSGVRDVGGVKVSAEFDPAIDEIPSGVAGFLVIDYGSKYTTNRYWSNHGAILKTRSRKYQFGKVMAQDLQFELNGNWTKGTSAPS